jgi:hypothetical protein
MSIHLDAFNPEITEVGISFFADINGKRVRCLMSKEALNAFEKGSDTGTTEQIKLFKDHWSEIQKVTYSKIQKSSFQPDGDIILQSSDFELDEKQSGAI